MFFQIFQLQFESTTYRNQWHYHLLAHGHEEKKGTKTKKALQLSWWWLLELLELMLGNSLTCSQSHYREVQRWEIFMEQELRSGLDLGQMVTFPAFIASKSFDPWNHHIPQMKMKWYNLWHILMYQKYMKFKKNH